MFTRDLLQHRVWSRRLIQTAPPEVHWADFQTFVSRTTNIVDFAAMQQESMAICRTGADVVTFTLGHATSGLEHSWAWPCHLPIFDLQDLVSQLRFEMWDDADIESVFLAAHVFPQVTPRESDHADVIYMVGAVEGHTEMVPILIVVWTMLEDGYHVERVPVQVARLLQCDLLLVLAGVDVLCQHVAVVCEISYDSQLCRRQTWYVQEGMKFAIDIMPAPTSEVRTEEVDEECDSMSLVQQGAACNHVRQNVLAFELTARRPLSHQWSFKVWWHDIEHRQVLRKNHRHLHKRSGDCMFCQVEYAFRHELQARQLVLTPVKRVHPDEEANWYVARPIEDRCVTYLVEFERQFRREYGTIVLCPAWEDATVQTVFQKIMPNNRCSDQDDCWLVDEQLSIWNWVDHLDLPDGSVIQPYRVEKETPNNWCANASDTETDSQVNDILGQSRADDVSVDLAAEGDSFSGMQQFTRWKIDDGRSSASLSNLLYSASHRLSWVTPVRLQYGELHWIWTNRHFDVVQAQLQTQGLTMEMQSMFGWLFRAPRQCKGDPFHWGLNHNSPWSLQVASLMRGAGLADSLLYTVIPQVPAEVGSSVISHMFLVTPLVDLSSGPLYLVVEHALQPPLLRQAIACDEPCTVKKVFELMGLGAWCTRRHNCGVAFIHGVCRKDFKNDEIVEVPMASRVHLSVQLVRPTTCVADRASGAQVMVRPTLTDRSMQQARQVAGLLFPEGTAAYDRTVRQVRDVLRHGEEPSDQEDDQVHLMQQTLHQKHEARSSQADASESRGEGQPSPPSTLDTRSMQISTISSGPPTFGVMPNTDFDWILGLGEARRHIAAYAACSEPHETQILVHLIGLQNGQTSSVGAMCPLNLLAVDVSVCVFADWCQEEMFQLFAEYSRLFPVIGELYQNVPSLVIVQSLPNEQVPVVVHVASTGAPIFRVYLAAIVERIAMIEDWLTTQITILSPTVLTFNGAVVRGEQDVAVAAGAVFGVRIRARIEVVDPGSSTDGSGTALDLQTHATWSSADQSIPPVITEGGDFDGQEDQATVQGETDQTHLMQISEIIDASGHIHDQYPRVPHQDWLHDIEAFLPALRAAESGISDRSERGLVIQIVSGKGWSLKDTLVRVSHSDLQNAEVFRRLMRSYVTPDMYTQCRCFLARFRFLDDVPLLIAVRQLVARQVPQLVWFRSLMHVETKKIVLVESSNLAMDYYYKVVDRAVAQTFFQPSTYHFRADGTLVHHHQVVEWVPATVIQIDQTNPCSDDKYDATFPAVIQDEVPFMQATSRIVVGAPRDSLAPYVLSAYRIRSLRVFSWLHTWDKKDRWSRRG